MKTSVMPSKKRKMTKDSVYESLRLFDKIYKSRGGRDDSYKQDKI